MSKSSNSSSGIGLCGLVFIVFLVLKLAEIGAVANWSWWWVCSPLWLPLIVVLGFFLLMLLIGLVVEFFKR